MVLCLAAALACGFLASAHAQAPGQPTTGLQSDLYKLWMREGNKRERAGSFLHAAECYKKALSYQSTAEGWLCFGRALARAGKVGEARKALRRCLRIDPANIQAALLLAELLEQAGDAAAALAVIDGALKQVPQSADLWAARTRLLLELNKPEQARRAAAELVQLVPHNPETWYLAGLAAARCRRLPEAEHCLLRALAIQPDLAPAATLLLDVYLERGRWLDARALAERMTKANPQDWHAWQALVRACVELADVQAASSAASSAIAHAPPDQRLGVALRIAKLCLAKDLPEVVIGAIAPAAGKLSSAELWAYVAQAHERLARWADAGEAWHRAATLGRPDLFVRAAQAFLSAGQSTRAVDELSIALRAGTAAADDAIALARELRADQATAAIRRFLAARPNEPRLHLALSQLLLPLAGPTVAAAQAAEALQAAPAAARLQIARIYEAAGLPAAALSQIRQALRFQPSPSELQEAFDIAVNCGDLALADHIASMASGEVAGLMRAYLAALMERTPPAAELSADVSALAAARLSLAAGQPKQALSRLEKVLSGQPTPRQARAAALLLARLSETALAGRAALALAAYIERAEFPPAECATALAGLLVSSAGKAKAASQLYELVGRLRSWPAIAAVARALLALDEEAAARALAERGAAPDLAADARARCLAAAYRYAAQPSGDWLLDACALSGLPAAVVAVGKAAKLPPPQRPVHELHALAEALAFSPGDVPYRVLALLLAVGDEDTAHAFAASFDSASPTGRWLRAELELRRSGAEAAAPYLLGAVPTTRLMARRQVKILAAAGRIPEAEPAAAMLLRGDSAPEDLLAAAELALAAGDWPSAAWLALRAQAAGACREDTRRILEAAGNKLTPEQMAFLKYQASGELPPARLPASDQHPKPPKQ